MNKIISFQVKIYPSVLYENAYCTHIKSNSGTKLEAFSKSSKPTILNWMIEYYIDSNHALRGEFDKYSFI